MHEVAQFKQEARVDRKKAASTISSYFLGLNLTGSYDIPSWILLGQLRNRITHCQ